MLRISPTLPVVALCYSLSLDAATYISPSQNQAGLIKFNHIQTTQRDNVRANLVAKDYHPLYLGQLYQLNSKHLKPASGKPDAIYQPKSRQVIVKNILQKGQIVHHLTLVALGADKIYPHLQEYQVVKLISEFKELKEKQIQANRMSKAPVHTSTINSQSGQAQAHRDKIVEQSRSSDANNPGKAARKEEPLRQRQGAEAAVKRESR